MDGWMNQWMNALPFQQLPRYCFSVILTLIVYQGRQQIRMDMDEPWNRFGTRSGTVCCDVCCDVCVKGVWLSFEMRVSVVDHGCLTCCLLPACSLLIDWGAAQGGREGGRGRILFEHRKQMVIEKEGGGRFLKYKFQKSLFWNIHSHSTTCFLLLLIIIHYAHLLLCLDRQKVVPKLHALLALFSSPSPSPSASSSPAKKRISQILSRQINEEQNLWQENNHCQASKKQLLLMTPYVPKNLTQFLFFSLKEVES